MLPMHVRCQTAPHPESFKIFNPFGRFCQAIQKFYNNSIPCEFLLSIDYRYVRLETLNSQNIRKIYTSTMHWVNQ